MKRYKIALLTLTVLLFAMVGCQNEGFYYQDEARVRIVAPQIWSLGTDSLEFSFVTQPVGVNEYDMMISLEVMGVTESRDRVVNIVVDQSGTTANTSQFSFPAAVTIPSGSFNATFPVTLKRTADLQNQGVRLTIKVFESTDFKVGVREESRVIFKWNDILLRPNNWADLVEFFGEFSLVKYRFMLNTLGISDFNKNTMSWAQLMNYKIQLQNALSEYNAANPGNPLTDEYNNPVTF